jgi:hypothetical protein
MPSKELKSLDSYKTPEHTSFTVTSFCHNIYTE